MGKGIAQVQRGQNKVCVHLQCSNKVYAKGICYKHYQQLMGKNRKLYTVAPEHRKRKQKYLLEKCRIEGCDGIYFSKGYCHKHYTKHQRLKKRYNGHD